MFEQQVVQKSKKSKTNTHQTKQQGWELEQDSKNEKGNEWMKKNKRRQGKIKAIALALALSTLKANDFAKIKNKKQIKQMFGDVTPKINSHSLLIVALANQLSEANK